MNEIVNGLTTSNLKQKKNMFTYEDLKSQTQQTNENQYNIDNTLLEKNLVRKLPFYGRCKTDISRFLPQGFPINYKQILIWT